MKRYQETYFPQNKNFIDDFSNIDASADPSSFISYFDKRQTNEQFRLSKQYFIKRILCPQIGDKILDVGCGIGQDAMELAQFVGAKGQVLGIDQSICLLKEARYRAGRNFSQLKFFVEDAHHLSFADNVFNGILAASTFMHLEHPKKALAEMVRVLKRGGRIVALESDWDTLVLSMRNKTSSQSLMKILRQNTRHSGIGHQLPTLFWEAGLKNIDVGCGLLMVDDFLVANDIWRIQDCIEKARQTGCLSEKKINEISTHFLRAGKEKSFLGTAVGFMIKAYK